MSFLETQDVKLTKTQRKNRGIHFKLFSNVIIYRILGENNKKFYLILNKIHFLLKLKFLKEENSNIL